MRLVEERVGEDEDGDDAGTRMQTAMQARDVAIAARRVALAGAQQELLRLRRDRLLRAPHPRSWG